MGGPPAAPDLVERILRRVRQRGDARQRQESRAALDRVNEAKDRVEPLAVVGVRLPRDDGAPRFRKDFRRLGKKVVQQIRSEEHTSELQSLMRISYAVFCLK